MFESILPDMDPFFRSHIHFISGLDIKRLVPGIHLHNWTIGTVHAWRMGIGQDQLCLCFWQGIVAPYLRPV